MMTLEDYLEANARRHPDKTALVCAGEQCSYKELWERVLAYTGDCAEFRRGQIVCLRASSTIDFVVAYFSLHRMGCVVVPLEQSMPDETFLKLSAEMSAHVVPEGTADILYTTGTTGRSKGVIVSHSTIIADAENLIDGQGFTHETVFVINGPLNHIGSLSKIYPIVMLGATMILVDGLKDLERFFGAFSYPSAKMATFLVPASIRILLQFGAEKIVALAAKMDFIETGAAAISQTDMEALCRLLPNTRLYNTYASTETGIISTYNYNDGECIAGCLGRPMKHSKIIITPEGHIACQGPTLMSGYVGDAERTASVLHDGTLFTSDLGRLDSQGRLHLKGREDDVINVGGFKVSPTEVEEAALSFATVKDCICIAVQHPVTGCALKLLVAMAVPGTLNKKALAVHLKSKLELYKVPMLYEEVDAVRRTFNGKLDRKSYKQ